MFQWVPDHLAVLHRPLEGLSPGGVLAVLMPDKVAEPSHRLMQEAADALGLGHRVASAARDPLPAPAAHYDALRPLSARLDLWPTTYHHPLDGAAAIVAWVAATGLKPSLARLGLEERTRYLPTYEAGIALAYPARADGRALLAFPRLFLVAVRGEA